MTWARLAFRLQPSSASTMAQDLRPASREEVVPGYLASGRARPDEAVA
ncbi:MAG: hypothetical protein WED86_06570 [Chloroflexota bacterium]